MNLFAARVAMDANGRPTLAVAGTLLALPDTLLEVAAKHDGATLTAGVRPESLALVAPGAKDALPARLEHVELLGHETLVHLRVAGELQWIARTPGMESHARDESIGLQLDPRALHLFSAEGRRLP
jgi:ABC-type sugar transport system ATPase subunit